METQIARSSAQHVGDDEFVTLLARSRAGDSQALMRIVDLLEPDIQQLSRKMRMDRSDAAQTLRTELIERVLNGRAD